MKPPDYLHDTICCKHFGVCGGCDSQGTPYTEQLKDKEFRLRDLFSQFDIKEFNSIVPSPRIFYYRNKMEYAVGSGTAGLFIGLRQKKRFYRVVDLEECKIFCENIKTLFDIFKEWIKNCGIEPYQMRRHSGVIRYMALRHSKYYDELMVIVVVTSKDVFVSPLVERLKSINNIKSVYLCINDKRADIAVADSLMLLSGSAKIRERVNDVDYLISPASFFQTNSYCCAELYNAIKKETKNLSGSAIDICCGSGGIALQVASFFSCVVGVDISARTIEDARENAKTNGIDNVEFVMDTAEKFLSESIKSKSIRNFSTIIVDPPRAGLSKKGKSAILESGVKNVIYVSCNPNNLAEDLKILTQSYTIDKIVPVDMFPHTRHVEVIAILKANEV